MNQHYVYLRANPDVDDCLTHAARRLVAAYPDLEGYDLEPCWDGEDREVVRLTVPKWLAAIED